MINLSTNLRSILCNFAASPKSTEMLNVALVALEMHSVHQLTWGSTRMCGFLDSCVRCSDILIPFLDTITSAKLKPEQSAYLLSPTGLYVLELLADLHPILVWNYLRKVIKDEEDVLICEAYRIAGTAASNTLSCPAERAGRFLNSLKVDEHENIQATFTMQDDSRHTVTLNKRITGRYASL